jgi:hypothetical protein
MIIAPIDQHHQYTTRVSRNFADTQSLRTMKMTRIFILLIAVVAILSASVGLAQKDVALLRDLAEENKKSVEALVLYPSETRLAILEATKHPEVLIKLQDMRERTTAAFRTLMEDFPRKAQDVFYDINRYPGLVEDLVAQQKSAAGLKNALAVLPEYKREDALAVVSRQMLTLEKIKDLNQTTNGAFERLTSAYSTPAQEAFRHLLGMPEVVDLLNEDLRLTVLVGETYRDNPAWVIQKTDSLHLAVARSHAEELENWKTTLENDPNAKAELQAAADDYAAENGYTSEDNDGDDLYDRQYRDVYTPDYYYPYSYWYGYPWWEPYPRWHPYPWWWDWGIQYYPYGVVVVYLPSYHFMHWYFDHPSHHEHYNHLSTHFINHYNGHRHSGTTISEGVRDWHDRNRTVISDEFLSDKDRLPDRLKEYGRFEQNRQDYNAKNPKKAVSQADYLEKNAPRYPEIKRSNEVSKKELQRENDKNLEKRSDWAPQKAPVKPDATPAPSPERPPRVVPTPKQYPPKADKPDYRAPTPAPRPITQPDEAKDYHRQKWEQTKPAQQNQKPAPNPTPRPQKTAPKNQTRPKN